MCPMVRKRELCGSDASDICLRLAQVRRPADAFAHGRDPACTRRRCLRLCWQSLHVNYQVSVMGSREDSFEETFSQIAQFKRNR